MKNFKIYAFLTFLFLGSTFVSAQSMLELYFGGNKDSLTTEVTKLIHLPEPTFKSITQPSVTNPEAIADLGFEQFSYRANKSTTPDDYVAGLKAVNKPMLVLMGSEDEAFSPTATKETILKNSNGQFQLIDKTSHNGVRHNAQSFIFIRDWFSKL